MDKILPASIKSHRITKEQRETLIWLIDRLIEVRNKEIRILNDLSSKMKKDIKNLTEVKRGRYPLSYLVKRKGKGRKT